MNLAEDASEIARSEATAGFWNYNAINFASFESSDKII